MRRSLTEAARAIRAGETRSEAVVSECLARIRERESVVHAWAFLDPELALRQARERDRGPAQGPLHGVPIGVKDIIDTADMPTEMGSPIWRGHRPRADAACVALVRAAGAVILGKAVTCEFAGMTPGATTNPLDPTRTPGGSSSGSAAAVGDFMVPAAFGTQTGGSVLRPAVFCGAFGYKPTFGRFNRAGVKPAAESFDTIGLIARSIDDLQLLDSVLTGRRFNPSRETKVPRVGFCRTHLWHLAQPETVAAVEDAAERFKACEIELPGHFADLTLARERIANYERAHCQAWEWQHHRSQISERMSRLMQKGLDLPPEQYWEAQRFVHECRRSVADAMKDTDVLLTACTPGEAPKGLESTGDPRLLEMWTLLHLPTMSLPTHRGPNGLPVGIQLVAAHGAEDRLFDAARWIFDVLKGGAR